MLIFFFYLFEKQSKLVSSIGFIATRTKPSGWEAVSGGFCKTVALGCICSCLHERLAVLSPALSLAFHDRLVPLILPICPNQPQNVHCCVSTLRMLLCWQLLCSDRGYKCGLCSQSQPGCSALLLLCSVFAGTEPASVEPPVTRLLHQSTNPVTLWL